MIAKFTKNLSVDQLEQIINNTPEQDKLNLFNLTDSELRLNYFIQKLTPVQQIQIIRTLPMQQSISILQRLLPEKTETALQILLQATDLEALNIFKCLNIQTKYNIIQRVLNSTNLQNLKKLTTSITPEEITLAYQQNQFWGYELTSLIHTINAINT
jgi:hypothetical protein